MQRPVCRMADEVRLPEVWVNRKREAPTLQNAICAEAGVWTRSADRFDPNGRPQFSSERPLDAVMEGLVGRWAPDAGPVEADLDQAVGPRRDELEVAAVFLDRGPDPSEQPLDLLAERSILRA